VNATLTTKSTETPSEPMDRVLATLLLGIMIAISVAIAAGLALLIVDPASGSTTEAVFGVTAATAGLSTAVLAIGTAIYAHIRNLWRFAPTWTRYLVMALVIVMGVRSIISWIV